MKITDKERLDWMEHLLQKQLNDMDGIGVTQFGMTYISGMEWPNRSIRKAIDAALRASRRPAKSKKPGGRG